MTVHENIRKIRKEKNLTQKQLGDLVQSQNSGSKYKKIRVR